MSQNTLQELRPLDEPLLHRLMTDLPLAQMILRLITSVADLELTAENVGTDTGGKKYIFDVQKEDIPVNTDKALSRMADMTAEHWKSISERKNLPAVYLIIFTKEDPFGHGDAVYHFCLLEDSRGEPLTGADHILYVNGAYESDDEIGRLLHDFRCTDPDDMSFKQLADRVRFYKKDPKGVSIINE